MSRDYRMVNLPDAPLSLEEKKEMVEEALQILEEARTLGHQIIDALTRGTPKIVTCIAAIGIVRTLKQIAPMEWSMAEAIVQMGEKEKKQ